MIGSDVIFGVDAGVPIWGRPLAVSRDAAMPFLGDDPATLDAQP